MLFLPANVTRDTVGRLQRGRVGVTAGRAHRTLAAIRPAQRKALRAASFVVAEATTYKAVYLDEAYVPRRFPAGLAQYQVYSNECSSLGQADVLHRGAANCMQRQASAPGTACCARTRRKARGGKLRQAKGGRYETGADAFTPGDHRGFGGGRGRRRWCRLVRRDMRAMLRELTDRVPANGGCRNQCRPGEGTPARRREIVRGRGRAEARARYRAAASRAGARCTSRWRAGP